MSIRSLTHWGLYDFDVTGNRIIDVRPAADDPDPSPLGRNLIAGNHDHRVLEPSIRRGYLSGLSGVAGLSDGKGIRGEDEFVAVSWDEALSITASALDRVRKTHGNEAIYGGSYGWASAGRFHHALSQLHRFLTCIGGYTASRDAYSFAAAEVILPHVIGRYEGLLKAPGSWPTIIDNCQLMVCFGGLPLRNSQITNGGMGRHVQRDYMLAAAKAGVRFVNIGPSRGDIDSRLDADWLPTRPGTDVALMLGLAHEIHRHDWHDRAFLATHCHGFEEFAQYLTGASDGQPKDIRWAAEISGVDAAAIANLAKDMAQSRTMISISWSLSRHQHGEQPYWMGITLAAMLGQIGLPGRGIGLGYGVENKVGKNVQRKLLGQLPRGRNPIDTIIPVARIADMLAQPGGRYSYDGNEHTYPDIRLVYWAGGNPFHHHQDLNRLKRAWQRPDTIICHELVWNATAKHADIVLPVASFLERNDIGGAPNEDLLVAMKQALQPPGKARTDYRIFSDLAARLGAGEAFTEGRSEADWLRHLYDITQLHNPGMPDFDTFWGNGEHAFAPAKPHTLFAEFREKPGTHRLATKSGLIEISTVLSADDSSASHATWHEPAEWLGDQSRHRFHLISHQPATRLHSQLDQGEVSQASKIDGLEPLTMNRDDAASLGLSGGERVRVFNERGGFFAGLNLTPDLMPGVLHIATGAWWDPDKDGNCRQGNPNAVTPDFGTSEIAQGPAALTCMVSVEKA